MAAALVRARSPARRRRLRGPSSASATCASAAAARRPSWRIIARWLVADRGTPAILSRGYGRRAREPGVTVVSDGAAILADLDTAGDEPLMLARTLPGVAVLVGANRYLSGRLAEEKLGGHRSPARRWVSALRAGARRRPAGGQRRRPDRRRCRPDGCASRWPRPGLPMPRW